MLHSLNCTRPSHTAGTAGLLDGVESDSDSEPDLPSGAEMDSSSGEEGSSDGEDLLLPPYCFISAELVLCLATRAHWQWGHPVLQRHLLSTGLLC